MFAVTKRDDLPLRAREDESRYGKNPQIRREKVYISPHRQDDSGNGADVNFAHFAGPQHTQI